MAHAFAITPPKGGSSEGCSAAAYVAFQEADAFADEARKGCSLAAYAAFQEPVPNLPINAGTKEEVVVESHLLESKPKIIHRFPSNLLRIGRERDYIAPRTVAIGPYYHGKPELRLMEELKHTVVDQYFFQGLAESARKKTYEGIKPIAREARGFYDDADALKGITDDGFSEMMFVDGCFLVQFMYANTEPSLRSMIQPHLVGIMRDIMLLENQIPWPVMESLMDLRGLTVGDIISCLTSCLHGSVSTESFVLDDAYKPSHLLCLVRFFEAGCLSAEIGFKLEAKCTELAGKALAMYTSAAELAEIGIKLEAKCTSFSAMKIVKDPFFAKLYLAPLNLDTNVLCLIVNMAALEMRAEISSADDCSINSYLAILSLLVNREDDIRELRAKRIVHGSSNQEALEFFKGLAPNLCEGKAYSRIIIDLAKYKQERKVWIAIYRFFYNNFKTIATVLSVIGVLVGIFKTLLSLKQNQH